MRSLDGLTLQQVQFAGFVRSHQTGGSRVETGVPEGAPPIFRPEALKDRPGLPVTGYYLNVQPSVGRPAPREESLLGSVRLVRWGLQRAVRGSQTPATQAFVNPTPRGWPIPPAWAIATSPDQELRYGSPSVGNY